MTPHHLQCKKSTSLPTQPTVPPPSPKRAAVTIIGPPNKKPNASVVAPLRSALQTAQQLPAELGKYVERDLALLQKLGWQEFVRQRRGLGDFTSLDRLRHPARRLLRHYKYRGAPVRFKTRPWSTSQIKSALARGPHKSALQYVDFLHEEFIDMIEKGYWIVLPASACMDLPGLRLSPPGVVPQHERRPRWICDYSFWGVNQDTLPLAALESMQFGGALPRLLREILLANPALGTVRMIKVDLSDGFYRIALNPDDIPKLGVVFPTRPGEEELVAFPLVLPMGWANSPPIFSTATETIADVANSAILSPVEPAPHHLDEEAASMDDFHAPSSSPLPSIPTIARDPALPHLPKPVSYVDVFVDDFIGLCQGKRNSRRVRRILMHSIDEVFRPNGPDDSQHRKEPVSIKKLRDGDCSWTTIKKVLGWIIDTVNLTISLPDRRVQRLGEILASIPPHQKRTSMKKWHKVLGELRSMSIALPGAKNLFSSMQNALSLSANGHRVALNKGVHDALNDFRWMYADISNRPTRIAELVPLDPSLDGHHDASGKGTGGAWFPGEHVVPRGSVAAGAPVVWRHQWPKYIMDRLITDQNPNGTITIGELELAGGLLNLECAAQCFDIRERTVLSRGDNLTTTFLERKGCTSSNTPTAYLLRLFGLHQRLHRYVPRFDYLSGPSNLVADPLSRDFHLSMSKIMTNLRPILPQNTGYYEWTPSPQILSAVHSALLRKPCNVESLWVEPPSPTLHGKFGPSSQPICWPSTPYSRPSKTKYQSYKSLDNLFEKEHLQPSRVKSALGTLRITYGQLARRSCTWGPKTPA